MQRLNIPHKRSVHIGQRGDTIIEALIAVAIVSLILTSAYMLTNRNKAYQQTAQEQTTAQKLVERQVELLRGSNLTINNACLDNGGIQVSGASCQVDASGAPSGSNGATYTLSITTTSVGGGKNYKAQAKWTTITGSQATVTMYYYE